MSDEIIIRLLRKQYEHSRRLNQLPEELVCLYYFGMNIVDEIFDLIGIPQESSEFSREEHISTFDEIIRRGTYEECVIYLQRVREGLEKN